MPSVQHASMPSPRTTRTISSTRSNAGPSATSRQAAPMQKRVAPCARARAAASRISSSEHEILARDVGLVVRRLRTVGAVLRTAAGLDAEQHAALHLVGASDARDGPAAPGRSDRKAARCRSSRSRRASSRAGGRRNSSWASGFRLRASGLQGSPKIGAQSLKPGSLV